MQVTVEESGVIERKLTVSIPHTEVDQEIEKRLKDVARNAKIPGFRPGRAPRNVINKRYGGQVTNEVIADTINNSYREALGKEELVPAGLVSIEPKPFVSGDDLEYVATIELFPEIPKPSLAGCKLENPEVEITGADVDRTLEDIRSRNADYVAREAAAETGDRVTVDFLGRIDGEAFEGGAAEDYAIVLGQGQMLEDFEKGLAGVVDGEEKQIAFTFPEDYPGGDVAGKEVVFDITVKAVEKPVAPELDDAFAEKMGIAEGGMAKMREEVEVSLKRELSARLRATIRDRVMENLMEVNEFEVPRALVEEEIDRTLAAMKEQMGGREPNDGEIDRSRFEEEARRRVTLGLIAREVIEQAGLKVDGALVRERVEEMATGYDDSEGFVNWYYSDPARLQQVESQVLEEQVVNHLLGTAEVTQKQVSFQDFMNPGS